MSMLYLRRGNSYADLDRIRIAFTNEDTGEPIDLTGADVWFVIKQRRSTLDADAYLFADTGSVGGVEIDTDPTTGLAWVTIESDEWDDVPVGAWWYAAQALDSSGRIVEVGPHRVTIEQDVITTTTVV